ncbi:hypothetical protein P170DRAFT_420614 [Aspergillus steynii IBT 23096]|uniref:DUF7730 domain-containing protein n=1 Tax=Aspergillus steynii IBT 23096 TaxID=1392250 RepID=A0A2I2GLQ9_9EURO|nr:uncharacterized protein P170DRAFT_420614 [Aspergillus steynii IBT 23096]PLB53806.1 hypothetical protein P170DRAFT_420614 [Aspergillus steynii IBT 23096]
MDIKHKEHSSPYPPLSCSIHSTSSPISPDSNKCASHRSQLTPPTKIDSGEAANQSQSPFLSRLPLEIRRIIYQAVIDRKYQKHLNPRTTHFIRHDESSRIRCPCPPRPWNSPGLPMDEENPQGHTSRLIESYIGRRRKPPRKCDLLVACRQVYCEAVDILTSNVTFSIIAQERDDLLILHDMQDTMPWSQYHAIRSIELSYHIANNKKDFDDFQSPLWYTRWAEFCACLEHMTGLRDLHMWINNEYSYNRRRELTPDQERQILEPLTKIRDLRNFKVEISWLATVAAADVLINAPFTLIRRPGFKQRKTPQDQREY